MEKRYILPVITILSMVLLLPAVFAGFVFEKMTEQTTTGMYATTGVNAWIRFNEDSLVKGEEGLVRITMVPGFDYNSLLQRRTSQCVHETYDQSGSLVSSQQTLPNVDIENTYAIELGASLKDLEMKNDDYNYVKSGVIINPRPVSLGTRHYYGESAQRLGPIYPPRNITSADLMDYNFYIRDVAATAYRCPNSVSGGGPWQDIYHVVLDYMSDETYHCFNIKEYANGTITKTKIGLGQDQSHATLFAKVPVTCTQA